MSDFKFVLLIVIGTFSLTSFLFGTMEGLVHGKCENKRIMSYFPAKLIGCWLTKERFE